MDVSTEPVLTKSQKVFTMLGAVLGLLLAALDQTIVATAGPVIQRDLAIEASLYVWITTAYLVASTVLVPIYGKLSDLYGRKRILLVAIGIFVLGSFLCGVSQTAGQLIAFRAVQGVGSAGLFTSAFAVVADLFPPAERGKFLERDRAPEHTAALRDLSTHGEPAVHLSATPRRTQGLFLVLGIPRVMLRHRDQGLQRARHRVARHRRSRRRGHGPGRAALDDHPGGGPQHGRGSRDGRTRTALRFRCARRTGDESAQAG